MAIRAFRRKGLERFFTNGSRAGIKTEHTARLRLILGRLAVAREPRDMALPGLRLHQLRDKQAGRWAVNVSGNWRLTFRFVGQDITEVDYEDYH